MEFTLKVEFNVTPEAIYETWLSSNGHSAMTGGEATITDRVGDPFTAWDGYIKGKNLELEQHGRIVQSWRTTQFEADEPDSLLEIVLTAIDGGTLLTLNHSKVPESGEHYKQGWEDHYFQPMMQFFQDQATNND